MQISKKSTKAINDIHHTLKDKAQRYKERKEQLDLAKHIYQSLDNNENLIAEAPTGVGKTLAILMAARAKGGKVVIATANNTLLEQYVKKDLPFFKKYMAGTDYAFTWGRIKGKSNYLCRSRFAMEASPTTADNLPIDTIYDRTHGLFKNHSNEEWAKICVNDDCDKGQCDFFKKCDLFREKDNLQDKDIIVTNYDIVLLNILFPMAQLLPSYDYLILDEAHALPEKAMQYYGSKVTRFAINKNLRLAGATSFSIIDSAFDRLDFLMAEAKKADNDKPVIPVGENQYRDCIKTLHQELKRFYDGLNPSGQKAKKAHSLIGNYINTIDKILKMKAGSIAISWLERGNNPKNINIFYGPIFVDKMLNRDLFNDREREINGKEKILEATPVIMTSATISAAGDFEPYAKAIGCEDYNTFTCKSPFDYSNNCVLWVWKPHNGIDKPSHPRWQAWAAMQAEKAVRHTDGGAFMLCTSRKSMNYIAEHFKNVLPYPILVQDNKTPVPELLEQFKAQKNSVLVGTASFWEGVSIEGDDLRLVVLDKLPFPSPADPLFKARESYYKEHGRSSECFSDLMLYPAIIKLKQGFGRLIRTETDTGMVAILDPRLQVAKYRHKVLRSLPECPIVSVGKEV